MTKKEMIEELEKGKPGFTEHDNRIMMLQGKWFIESLYSKWKRGIMTDNQVLARLLTR